MSDIPALTSGDFLNFYFLSLLTVLLALRKILTIKELVFLISLLATLVIIHKCFSLNSYFLDQLTYLQCIQEIRTSFYELRTFDCIPQELNETFITKSIERFSLLYALTPIPFFESTVSGIFANYFFVIIFYIYYIRNSLKKPYVLLLIPSSMLFASLFLKEWIVILLLSASLISIFKKEFKSFLLFSILLFLFKFQAFIFIFLVGIIFFLQTIFLTKLLHAVAITLSLFFITIFSEEKFLDVINQYNYNFTVNAIKLGGIEEQNSIINSPQALQKRLLSRKLNPKMSECIIFGLNRSQCKLYIEQNYTYADFSSIPKNKVHNKLNKESENIDLKRIKIKGFAAEYENYFQVLSLNNTIRGITSPIKLDHTKSSILTIEKIVLILLIAYFLIGRELNSKKLIIVPLLSYIYISASILGAIVLNENNLWRYTIPYIISTIYCLIYFDCSLRSSRLYKQ